MVLFYQIQEEILSYQRPWSRQTSGQISAKKIKTIYFSTLQFFKTTIGNRFNQYRDDKR